MPFDPDETTNDPFTLPDGEQVDVPTMHRDVDAAHGSRDGVEVLRLPHGHDQRYGTEVFLPPRDTDLTTFVGGFDPDRWAEQTADLASESEVLVALPTFELEYTARLDPVLRDLGIVDAHGPADFSLMVDGGGVALDTVVQKTFVRVDEAGTEAAAVTGGAIITSAPPAVAVDRPFLFTITDQQTGAVLFLGTVTDPRG